MKRMLMAALPGMLLAGCATDGAPAPQRAAFVPIPTGVAGLQGVLGQNARGLVALLGRPGADLVEGNARKMQFAGGTCVLDAYLYPKSGSEPVVTYIDARQTDGSPIDRASCVAALEAKARTK